jgi:hypothetical protein
MTLILEFIMLRYNPNGLPCHTGNLLPLAEPFLVRLQIDVASATELRHVVMRAGADAVRYLRVDACVDCGKVQAVLCIARSAMPHVLAELARLLPTCEVHPVKGARH